MVKLSIQVILYENLIRELITLNLTLRKILLQKKHIKNKNLRCPHENSDAVCIFYVGSGLNDSCIIRNFAHVGFNDKNLDNVRFVKVTSLPAVREHLTSKFYVDESTSHYVDESSLLRLDTVEKLNLDPQGFKILKSILTSPKTIIEIPTKSYVDSVHENGRNSRVLSTVFNN